MNLLQRAAQLEAQCEQYARVKARNVVIEPERLHHISSAYENGIQSFVFKYSVYEDTPEPATLIEIAVMCEEYQKLLAFCEVTQEEYDVIVRSSLFWVQSRVFVFGAGLD